jgi:dTDP-glucose 4,6-dehydratase
MTIIVTGGAGFIGSNFILNWLEKYDEKVINIDKLTYAGNINNLNSLKSNKKYFFIQLDINNDKENFEILKKYKPNAIINFAAESHVDRSIDNPDSFIHTNIVGTYKLLNAAYKLWSSEDALFQEKFKFIHVSTDEVYGTLDSISDPFRESDKYKPNSPYAASKASSDLIVRSYKETYGFPAIITNCSNNYGPYQFPEKLIPLVIKNALSNKKIPIYGDGKQIRDWLHVVDHCDAIITVLKKGKSGETYNIGGKCEKTNIDLVNLICELLDEKCPKKSGSYKDQIEFVKDRLGHDTRYAIDNSKIEEHLGWSPKITFDKGIEQTIEWYIKNKVWVENIINGSYKD